MIGTKSERAFLGGDVDRDDREPAFEPPMIACCKSAIATGGAYHSPECSNEKEAE